MKYEPKLLWTDFVFNLTMNVNMGVVTTLSVNKYMWKIHLVYIIIDIHLLELFQSVLIIFTII